MKTKDEVEAELVKVEEAMAVDERLPAYYTASLVARAEALRWVLDMEPMFGGDDD